MQMSDTNHTGTHARLGMRVLATACAVIVLIAGTLALEGPRPVAAQTATACEATDLGTLSTEDDGGLNASGRWTTEDCDSRFRIDSDAHSYRFQVAEGDRIRIDLASDDADPYLYLLAEDGSRITDNDDGGAALDARIERDLAAGTYLVEATTVGGRGRGPADFTLSISHVAGCEPVHLGTLDPGVDLTASGTWTIDTCGSFVVAEHPAYTYSFTLPQGGRVLIDLISADGDPVLSLATSDGRFIGANDDGGGRRNSRIEQYLAAGTYVIEATTYLQRDLQPLTADFDLVVHLVDEEARQHRFQLKIEETHAPDQVIAGVPFAVHYRAGNPGGGDLADAGGSVVVYAVAPGVFVRIPSVAATAERWQAGVSYHSGARTASATSVATVEVTPFAVTLNEPGPSWVFVAIIAFDEAGEEIAFHGIWRNLMVLSGPTFDPLSVSVHGADYTVAAEADDEGWVAFSVASVADPDADVGVSPYVSALYTAGVQTQLLDGIFERPLIAVLGKPAEPIEVAMRAGGGVLSSEGLIQEFGLHYRGAVAWSTLAQSVAAGELVTPGAVEDLRLAAAEAAAASYATLAPSWFAFQVAIEGGESLSFPQALTVHTDLAYAEAVLSPAAMAGAIVSAARAADGGWQAPAVQRMVEDLTERASCGAGPAELRSALEAAHVNDVDALLALDEELRYALPLHGLATDAALCAALDSNTEVAQFLNLLTLGRSEVHLLLVPPLPPAPEPALEPALEPAPVRLRVIVQLAEDGRLEHGVELPNGRSILPRHRFLNVDAEVDRWKISTMIEVDGQAIGRIRARRLVDGRVELSFRDVNDAVITPAIHYVPAELPPGFWLRSSEIVAPPPAPAGEAAAEPEPGMEAEPEQVVGTPELPASGGGGAQ